MISGIEVSNFKGFRHLELSGLGSFHVLVGPNGSGKSSVFEILEFVKDLLLSDVHEAVSRRRVNSLRDLTFDRHGQLISFLITFEKALFDGETVRYLLVLDESADAGVTISSESLIKGGASGKLVVRRNRGDDACYEREDKPEPPHCFNFPENRSALAQLPPDDRRYPTANRAKKLLSAGIQALTLDSALMGVPCPLGLPAAELQRDGRNLARVAGRLLGGRHARHAQADAWIYHLKLALEDLEDIYWRQQDDRTEYLVVRYKDGLEIPSWLASFGTLRTLALTLPAFLPLDEPRLYLFEEPENGIHPSAIEIVMSAIQTIPKAQVFVTTHSPMIVQQCGVDALLLFSKPGKEITIQPGRQNAILREWDGVPDLATVFSSRVLG